MLVLVGVLAVAGMVVSAPIASAKVAPKPPPPTAPAPTTTTAAPSTTKEVAPTAPAPTTAPTPTTVSADPPPEVDTAKAGAVIVDGPGFPGPVVPGQPAEEPPPQPNPRITLTPDTDLQDNMTLQVEGTGFTPNHSVGAAQCLAGATGVEDCDLGHSIITTSDADGNWTSSIVVSARISVGGEVIDCREPSTCVIGAARIYDYKEVAGAPLRFDPNIVLPPPPVVTITPSTDLVHDQQVTVSGTGFAPNDFASVQECTGAVNDGYSVCSFFPGPIGPFAPVTADGDGNLSTSFTVHRFLASPGGTPIDCAEHDTCFIQVTSFSDRFATGKAATHFDPDGPVPPRPTVTAKPSKDLVHNQVVTLDGTGFDPSEQVQVSQCSVSDDPFPVCSYSGIVFPVDGAVPAPPVDEAGNLHASFTVRRLIGYPGPDGQAIDCADPPGCVLQVVSYVNILHTVEVKIAFDRSIPPPPPPTVDVDPDRRLVHGQLLTVSAAGFAANDLVQVYECLESIDVVGRLCSYSGAGLINSDAVGKLTTTFTAKRVFGNPGEKNFDCVDGYECSIYLQSLGDPFATVEHELHFDPDAPLPPRPTLTVDPNTDLPQKVSAHVSGSGFSPNTSHNVVQCSNDSTFFDFRCAFGPTIMSDEQGNVDTEVTLRRYIQAGPEPIDCANPDGCFVAVYSYDDPLSFAVVHVQFDPNAPPPPRPALTVTPPDGLSDGTNVTVEGSGFAPNGVVGMSECTGADVPWLVCDDSIVKFVGADEHGRFTTDYTVHAGIQTRDGIVGCYDAPGACSLRAVDFADPEQISGPALLTFGASATPPGVGGGDGWTPVRSGPAPRLAFTGTPVAGYLEFAAISLGLGVLLVIAGRRRRPRTV